MQRSRVQRSGTRAVIAYPELDFEDCRGLAEAHNLFRHIPRPGPQPKFVGGEAR